MKKLIALTAGLLLTGSALADTITLNKDTNLSTASFSTKAEALDAGYDIAEQLLNEDQKSLRHEFRIVAENPVRNINIQQTEIKTEEFAVARDDIQYRAIVKVNYSFDTQDND
ncbi:DUF3316 domain-containing protein [Psychromonas sp. PT13]|uniref:DUF3316 domain-containing protein n=1 Tax=Psychromonas sp. PT13 TaxID=3439547 RepID=UPI003EC10242